MAAPSGQAILSSLLSIGAAGIAMASYLGGSAQQSSYGNHLFPTIVFGALSVALLANAMRYNAGEIPFKMPTPHRLIFSVLATVIYALLFMNYGYVIPTIITYVVLDSIYFRSIRLISLLYSAIFAFSTYYVFAMILKIPLPDFPLEIAWPLV